MVKRLEMDAEFLTTKLNWILNCPTKHLATRFLEETIRHMLTIELAHWGFHQQGCGSGHLVGTGRKHAQVPNQLWSSNVGFDPDNGLG